MTLLAQGTQPDVMLYEDAVDVAALLESTGRTVDRWAWCDDVRATSVEGFAEGFF